MLSQLDLFCFEVISLADSLSGSKHMCLTFVSRSAWLHLFRFGQLKKSSTPPPEAEPSFAEVLTLDDEDDDMVCMRSPSVSPLPRR